ncbi:MAG: holo-acyl-carrier protein synthase [Puniceicoccaceae bacterium 5H]|nr:MAG: holo-acyl-carrier protein synthase [Puniceicoccaceae bacterium 5H]
MVPAIQLPPGGSVLSVGTDLIECERVKQVYDRHPERFLERVYTECERAYCLQMKNPIPHLAARFAAKEAVAKCFTTGIGAEIGWQSIEVAKGERGEPVIVLDAQGQRLMEEIGGNHIVISLAHTRIYGHAVALLLQ